MGECNSIRKQKRGVATWEISYILLTVLEKKELGEALEICVLKQLYKQLYPKKETECDNLHCSTADIEGTVCWKSTGNKERGNKNLLSAYTKDATLFPSPENGGKQSTS